METHISLKEYFGGESTGFTPWLQKHQEIIQDILDDKEAYCYKREQQVGKFYIDLLFRNKNKLYIVENQYGESDHDHLGKCITYTNLVNASKTIWIVETISDEHLKAVEALNIDICICTTYLEKLSDSKVKLTLYCHYKTKPMKQFIYILDKDKDILTKLIA